MCYSAQVVQVIRKLHRQLGIRPDYAEAERLFLRRLDDPTLNISRGFEANFEQPISEQGRRIKQAIDEHRSRVAANTEKELFSQKTRLSGAQRSLLEKETKKAREDVRIAAKKIQTLGTKLSDLHRAEPLPSDNRIFPMVHAGVIIRREGEHVLTPMRYFCRPAGKPAVYDKKFPGLYNARRDNLEKFWAEQFGHHHAIMVVESFYENVQRQGKNAVLQFTPQPAQTMYIACLWSHWVDAQQPDLRGFAAITDEPPPDVAAAGHDRCIINLRPEHLDAWLTPEGRSMAELQNILSDRAVSVFQHVIEEAA
jgi:putative SOS response-associated peptidase YedK